MKIILKAIGLTVLVLAGILVFGMVMISVFEFIDSISKIILPIIFLAFIFLFCLAIVSCETKKKNDPDEPNG